jgi:polyribonucleotide nucleotidyltransferase
VIATVLSADGENDADMPGLVAASAALTVSDIPWEGPIAGVRVGLIDGKYVANPTYEERKTSKLDLVVTGSAEAIVMVEAGANEVTEDETLKAMQFAHEEIKKIVAVINDLQKQIGKVKQEFVAVETVPAELKEEVAGKIRADLAAKLGVLGAEDGLIEGFLAPLKEEYAEKLDGKQLYEIIHDVLAEETRKITIEKELRIDGRKLTQLRELEAEVDILPRPHGSAMFRRGQTQVLSIATLGLSLIHI